MPCAADAEYRLPSMWLVWLSIPGAGHGCVSAPGTVVPTSSNEPQIEEGPIWAHFAGLIEQAVAVAPLTDVITIASPTHGPFGILSQMHGTTAFLVQTHGHICISAQTHVARQGFFNPAKRAFAPVRLNLNLQSDRAFCLEMGPPV